MSRKNILIMTVVVAVTLGAIALGSNISYQSNLEEGNSSPMIEHQFNMQKGSAKLEGRTEITLKDELVMSDDISIATHRVITLTEDLGIDD